MTRDSVRRMWDIINRLRDQSRTYNKEHNEAEWTDVVILIERYGKEGVSK